MAGVRRDPRIIDRVGGGQGGKVGHRALEVHADARRPLRTGRAGVAGIALWPLRTGCALRPGLAYKALYALWTHWPLWAFNALRSLRAKRTYLPCLTGRAQRPFNALRALRPYRASEALWPAQVAAINPLAAVPDPEVVGVVGHPCVHGVKAQQR